MNAAVGALPWPCERVTEAKANVMGTTDGNIIATIITSHVTRKSPAPIIASPPIAIEPAWLIVKSHAATAQTRSAATIVVETDFGRGVTPADGRCCTKLSGRPMERRRERALAAVVKLHSESLDLRFGRPSDGYCGVRGMEDADQLAGFGQAFRRVILDFDGYVVADLHVVLMAIVAVF